MAPPKSTLVVIGGVLDYHDLCAKARAQACSLLLLLLPVWLWARRCCEAASEREHFAFNTCAAEQSMRESRMQHHAVHLLGLVPGM